MDFKVIKRFEDKFIPEPNSGCWLWMGAVGSGAYGKFSMNNRTIQAPRVSYELYNGPIPNNMVIRHKCDNPLCVNPDHLELGTHQDNMDDMVKRNRHKSLHGIDNKSAKLTEEQVIDIYKDNRSQRTIAKEYNVRQNVIYCIKAGKKWKHITKTLDQDVRPNI